MDAASSSSSLNPVSWTEEDSRVQLLIPSWYPCASEGFCHIDWTRPDSGEGGATTGTTTTGGGGFFKVLSDKSQTVLDVIAVDDVIGASIETLSDTQAQAVLKVYCYSHRKKDLTLFQKLGLTEYRHPVPDPHYEYSWTSSSPSAPPTPRVAAHREWVLAPVEDLAQVQHLVTSIRQLARGFGSTGSGSGGTSKSNDDRGEGSNDSAREVENQKFLVMVNPIAGKGQAVQICESTVCPMLDQAGIEYTVIQTTHEGHAKELVADPEGILKTSSGITGIIVMAGDGMFHEVINGISQQQQKGLMQRIKLGMVPCGTGSGLAASMAHASGEDWDVVSSCFLICKGQCALADTSLYTTQNHSYTGFLTFSWGFVADLDLESECIRWLGKIRFDLWAVIRIIFLRTYRGKLWYCTKPMDPSTTTMPGIHDPVPEDWKTLGENDEFILFWASQVSHASVGFHNSPHSRVGDGVFQIMLIGKPMSRWQMINVLLAMESGQHVTIPGVEFVKCTAWRLEPTGSFNVVDGERVEDGLIQAQVVPRSIQVFCRHCGDSNDLGSRETKLV